MEFQIKKTMTESHSVHIVIESFLNQLQSIGIVKEYNLNDVENNDKMIQDFKSAFKKFVGEVDTILAPQKKSEELEKIDVETIQDHEESKLQSSDVKKDNVQLQVDENEIKRRINAFVSRKRKEVDEWNVQEFCSRPYIEDENPVFEQIDSCARVDAVFIPRFGSKSHVKVSKVENRFGPQTQFRGDTAKRIKHEVDANDETDPNNPCLDSIQERIKSMEAHLNLQSEHTVRNSIFQRLKQLEDRILYLEGISPDYFNTSSLQGSKSASPKKKNLYEREDVYSNWSVDDIQKRIQSLKESLKAKSQMKLDCSG